MAEVVGVSVPWCKTKPLQWRHKGCDSVSNHQPLNRLFRRRSKETSKLRVTGLCAGNSPVTGEFSAQMASCAENGSIWWRHHATLLQPQFWNCDWLSIAIIIVIVIAVVMITVSILIWRQNSYNTLYILCLSFLDNVRVWIVSWKSGYRMVDIALSMLVRNNTNDTLHTF